MSQLIVETQGARLRKAGERIQVVINGKVMQSLPLNGLEQVSIMGQGVSASTPLLYDLVARGVDVIYQSRQGRFSFRLAGPASRHSAVRVRQVQVATDPARALPFARAMIVGKLLNQMAILRRYGSEPADAGSRIGLQARSAVPRALRILALRAAAAAKTSALDTLRGQEGSGAAAYFAAWPTLFEAGVWRFRGRAYHPPPDPVYALLSLGYTWLLNDIVGAMHRIGLDAAIGFFHTVDYGRPSLALDLEEEFRPVVVDQLVLTLLRRRVLEPSDFTWTVEEQVLLTDDARRLFIASYQAQLAAKVRHPGWRQSLTLRQCIVRQVEHLARCVLGREEEYRPLLLE